jgi:hypothetical protein
MAETFEVELRGDVEIDVMCDACQSSLDTSYRNVRGDHRLYVTPCQKAKPSDIIFKTHNIWRARLLPVLKGGVST